jgi:hypothetical protein
MGDSLHVLTVTFYMLLHNINYSLSKFLLISFVALPRQRQTVPREDQKIFKALCSEALDEDKASTRGIANPLNYYPGRLFSCSLIDETIWDNSILKCNQPLSFAISISSCIPQDDELQQIDFSHGSLESNHQ